MAVSRVTEKQKKIRQVMNGAGDNADWYNEEYDADVLTGWRSDITGQFYAADPNQINPLNAYGMFRSENNPYILQSEQDISFKEQEYLNQKETERLNTQYADQREAMRAADQQQRAQYAAEVEAQAKAAADQKAAFESEAQSRELARQAAEAKKQQELGEQRAISGASMLADQERIAGAKEEIGAAEDKKVLTAEDKEKMFNGDAAAEDKKKKQSILETILGKS